MKNNYLALAYEHIENCGSKTVEMVNSQSNFIDVPVFCNNRACQSPECNAHRGKLHLKNHGSQVSYAEHYIKSPKSFVFTGWVLNCSIEDIREIARKQLIRLFELLTKQSKTTFIIYTEFKLKEDGSYYLHFHVVTGSVGDIHLTATLWGRKVLYEYPVKSSESLIKYIKKYTGKSPVLNNFEAQKEYLTLTYKLQMCRYDIPRKKAEMEFKINSLQTCYPVSLIVSEMNSVNKRMSEWGEYVPYLDNPPNDIIPSCVYVYPTVLKSKYKSSKNSKNKQLDGGD